MLKKGSSIPHALHDLFAYLNHPGTRGNAAGSSQTGDALGKALASVSTGLAHYTEWILYS